MPRQFRRRIMKARTRRKPRKTTPWIVLGAVVTTFPSLHGAALPVERRLTLQPERRMLTLEAERLEAALAHIRIWTPSETLPRLPQERAAAVLPQTPAEPPPVFRFDIAPGPLAAALREFERLTSVTIVVDETLVRSVATAGVRGRFNASQALERLLAGTSLSHTFKDPATAAVDIRIDAASVDVTATANRVPSAKYTAPLSETPQTIQVIPRTLIEEQGAATLSDALRNVPGITMQAGEGGGASNTTGDMFNMRGFSANNSLFVDGVRDDGLISRDVFNLEQIEVFSGPTGADVGRTNAAGYINLTTKAPTVEALRAGTLGYSAGGQVRATVDVNQPLQLGEPGTFFGNAALRVNGLWQDGGVAGRDFVERENRSIAPSLAFGVNTATRASVAAQITRQSNLADYGLPAAASPIGPLTPTSALAATPVDQSTYYGSPDVDYDKVEQNSVTLRLERDVTPSLTVRNQTRYNDTERRAVITSIANAAAYDPATNLVTLSRQANERHNDVFSNQTAVTARPRTGGLRHDLSFGVEVATEKQFAPTLGGVGTRAPVDLNAPDVFSPVVGMNVVPTGALAEGSTNTAAVYVFDAVDLGPRVRVNGGVRVEHYRTTSHAVAATGAVTDIAGDGTLVSGKAGLVYRLNDAGNLYVSYGSSLTPPGSANFQLNAGAANQNNPNVDPQESINYEIGSKWDLAGSRLQLNGALFYTENTNVIFVVDAGAVPPIFNQDDGQRVKGVSLALVGRLLPRWDLNLSVQYLDSELRTQNAANDGRRLTLTPEVSGSVWTTVRLPREIRVGGGLRYTDRVFVNAANTLLVPRYAVADALIEVPVSRQLLLRVNVYNLTDNEYIRNINNNGGRYNLGTPRSFLLSTAVRF
jgi:catecholate siderophore receptor